MFQVAVLSVIVFLVIFPMMHFSDVFPTYITSTNVIEITRALIQLDGVLVGFTGILASILLGFAHVRAGIGRFVFIFLATIIVYTISVFSNIALLASLGTRCGVPRTDLFGPLLFLLLGLTYTLLLSSFAYERRQFI